MPARLLRIALWLAAIAILAGFLAHSVRGFHAKRGQTTAETALFERASRIAQGSLPYAEGDPAGPNAMPVLPFVLAGLGFARQPWELHFVTALATLLAAIVVARTVRDETRSATLGVASASFLVLGITLAGGSPTGPAADTMMLLLALAGSLLLRWWSSLPGTVLASLMFAAACFTHASAFWFAAAALFHLGMLDRRRSIAYAIGLLVFVGGGHVALSMALGPWFNFHTWDAPLAAVRFQPVALLDYLGLQLLGALGVLSFATVLSFALPVPPWRSEAGIWTWLSFAALGAGIGATQSLTGTAGALRPAVVVLAVAGPIAIQRVAQHLSNWPGSSRLGGRVVVLTALALQLLMLLAHLPVSRLGTHT